MKSSHPYDQFDDLSLDARTGIVVKGHCINIVNYYGFMLRLYSLPNGQWAEIWFNPRIGLIVDVRLIGYKELEKYLNQITVNCLFNCDSSQC